MSMTKADDQNDAERLGEEGEACAQCGTRLATDQRYCLTCGTPRAEPRLDFQRHLSGEPARPAAGRGSANGVQWSPLLVIVAIAALGVMLLLGVLIGKGDNDLTVTEVPASTTTTTGEAIPTTADPENVPTTTTTTPAPKGTKDTAPKEGGGVQGRGEGAGGVVAPGGTD